eukprot:m.74584 g.74584  ORF g.74584 m.74584 type:complete len:255 (+) comp14368_c0_seq3:650-1414(+)
MMIVAVDWQGVGTFVINLAARKQWVDTITKPGAMNVSGMYTETDRPPAGYQVVPVDAIDSLALHVSIVAMTTMAGYVLKRSLIRAEAESEWLSEYGFFSAFPTFPFCMFAGIAVQLVCDKFADPSPLDRGTIERISGLALEYTIVSAIATMKFNGLEDALLPFAILTVVTWVWHFFCFFVLAPRLLPDAWVQRSVAEMGQSMGVTSTAPSRTAGRGWHLDSLSAPLLGLCWALASGWRVLGCVGLLGQHVRVLF